MKFYASDLHFGHNKDFIYKLRGFDSVYDMNEAIINNWNSIVNPDDDVYVLGDLMLGDNEAGVKLIKQLKGNIHIILGNHDSDPRIELYNQCYNVVEVCYATMLKYNGFNLYLYHYPVLCSNVGDKGLKHRIISLCGHTHTKDKFENMNLGYIYHCELDAHDMKPVSIDEIIRDLTNFKFVKFMER